MILSEDNYLEIEKLAAIGYSPKEMALYFEMNMVERKEFEAEAFREGSRIIEHINYGKAVSQAKRRMKMVENAEKGNITAEQMLQKKEREDEIKAIRNKVLYGE